MLDTLDRMAKLTCSDCGQPHVPLWRCPNAKRKGSRRPGAVDVTAPAKKPATTEVLARADSWLWLVEAAVAEMEHRRRPGKFDRTAYQREYMRDKRAADKLGLTVREYRARKVGR